MEIKSGKRSGSAVNPETNDHRGRSRRWLCAGLLAAVMSAAACSPAFASIFTVENTIMPILNAEVSRQDPAIIGEEFTIYYLVKNISDHPAFNLEYSFNVVDAKDSYPFSLAATPDKIEQLAPSASALVPVKFLIQRDAREKEYWINGTFTYDSAAYYGNLEIDPANKPPNLSSVKPPSANAQSWVPITFATVKPNLIVTELTVLEENPNIEEGFTVRLGLKNSSLIYDLRNVLIQMEGGENFECIDITNKKEAAKISVNQVHIIDFRLRAKENRKSNTVVLNTSFSYPQGTAPVENQEELFIPVKEDAGVNGKIPQVIIKRYTLSKEQVLAGDRIDLTLEIENTNSRPVKNVLINFGVESMSSESGSSSSSTVFAPVGSSNTFHVDEIRGKSTIANTITFAVDSSAIARTYIVPVTITYEDEKGIFNDLRVKDNVNIPVTQQAKLSITSMTLPSYATAGMPTPVMAEFVNSGKVDLADFTVRLEGGFETMDASLYMAKLMIGATTSYTGMLIAQEEGDKEGTLIISYLDNNNQEIVEEHPFTVSVSPMEDPAFPDGGAFPPDGGMTPPDEGGNPVVRFLTKNWLSILYGSIILIQSIVILRLRKKAKEAFFDE